MEFAILGPLMVTDGGRPVEIGGRKQRALLALLLVNKNRVVSVDRIIDELWGDDAPNTAVGALQVYVSHLRRIVEPARAPGEAPTVLVTRAPGYVLHVDPEQLDVSRFEAGAAAGARLLEQGRVADARRSLDECLALWRGPLLADFGSEGFVVAAAAHLDELRVTAQEDRAAAQLAVGRSAEAVADLEVLVAQWPFRERLWELLILALYRDGRQADALRAYARVRTTLADELGLQPGASLRRLEADVLDQAPSLDWQPPPPQPPPAATSDRATPLPSSSSAASSAPGDDADCFVGRADPLAELLAAVERARRGCGRVVFVAGEPGIGKTRLVQEAARRAADIAVVWGRGEEGEGAPPFWPWVQIIRALLAAGRPEQIQAALAPVAAEIAQIVPEVKDLTGPIEPLPLQEPAAALFSLNNAVTELVLSLAGDTPLMVVVDDLQWADPPSLRLTAHLASRLESHRLVLVGTYRDVDPLPGDDLSATLGVLARHGWASELVLTGFSEGEVARYLQVTLGTEPIADTVTNLRSRTNGNPFFVGELARLAASEHPAVPGSSDATIPRAVRQVIRRRLAGLPGETNRMLALAAVIGEEFDLHAVAAASGTELDRALDLIDLAIARGVIADDAGHVGRLRFAHALVRETIYAQTKGLRRAQLHAQVGEALRASPQRASPAELAHHFYQAVPVLGPRPAISTALSAARAATDALAFDGAEHYLRRAVALTEQLEAGKERDQLELAAQEPLAGLLSLVRGVGSPETGEAWARAASLARHDADRRRMVRSLWGSFVFHLGRARFADAEAVARHLFDLGEGWADPEVRIAALLAAGGAAFFQGRLSEAKDHLCAARSLLDEHPDLSVELVYTDLTVSVDVYLAMVTSVLGDRHTAKRYAQHSMTRADQLGQTFTTAVSLVCSGLAFIFSNLDAEARDAAERLASFAREYHMIDFEHQAAFMLQWADAQSIAVEQLAAYRPTGRHLTASDNPSRAAAEVWSNRLLGPLALAIQAEQHRREGHPEQALGFIQAAIAQAEETNEVVYLAELLRLRGELLALGSPEQVADAETCLLRAVSLSESQGAADFARRSRAALRTVRDRRSPAAATRRPGKLPDATASPT